MRCNNPIDTPQQREHELQALRYYRHPEIQARREEVRSYWLDLVKPGEAMLRSKVLTINRASRLAAADFKFARL